LQFRPLILMSALTMFGGPMILARLAAQNTNSEIISFAAPGAGTAAGSGSGTFPESINSAGAITGHYADANSVNHGFLRTPRGNILRFDVSGAGTTAGSGTFPESINFAGAITGHYTDANNVNHGFLRTPQGDITTFDAPGADTTIGSGNGTFPESINAAGAITGRYVDGNTVYHGFIRSPGGAFTTFDAPRSSSALDDGTFPASMNDTGVIIGRYVDRNTVCHGFLRSPGGRFVVFDAPGSSSALDDGTFPRSINSKGAITGNYSVADKEVNLGFLRSP